MLQGSAVQLPQETGDVLFGVRIGFVFKRDPAPESRFREHAEQQVLIDRLFFAVFIGDFRFPVDIDRVGDTQGGLHVAVDAEVADVEVDAGPGGVNELHDFDRGLNAVCDAAVGFDAQDDRFFRGEFGGALHGFGGPAHGLVLGYSLGHLAPEYTNVSGVQLFGYIE